MTQAPQRPGHPPEPSALPVRPQPAATARPATAGPALELLVHGVGGATPDEMLADPHPVRILGDDTAGLYRRRQDMHAEDAPPDRRPDPLQEAYCWSGLTSGDGTRALWLLLLPFMVVNLAHWMRPPGSAVPHRRAGALYDLLLRLLALVLTVLFAAGACEVAMDQIAWQCAGGGDCAAHQSWLHFAANPHNWWHQPGRRIALAALVPLALVGLLGWLSHRTWSAFEAHQPDDGRAAEHREAPMELAGFWYGKRAVGRLRIAHLAAALATVAAGLIVPALRQDTARGGPTVLLGAGALLAALLAATVVGVLVVLVGSVRREDILDDQGNGAVVRNLHRAALGICVVAAVYAGWSRTGWTSADLLPGAAVLFTVLAAGQLALVAGLAAVTAVLAGRRRRPAADQPVAPYGPPAPPPRTATVPEQGRSPGPAAEDHPAAGPVPDPVPVGEHPGALHAPGFGGPGGPALGGFAGPATAMLACGVAVLFTSGAVVWTADWLNRGAGPGQHHGAAPLAPLLLTWHAVCFPVVLLLIVVLLLAAAGRMLLQQRRLSARVAAEYGVAPGDSSPERSAAIAGALARARLTDSGPPLIGALALFALLACGGSLAGALVTHLAPADAADGTPTVVSYATDTAQALGSWLIGTSVVTLVTLGRRAYKGAAARRTVGILWDIGTFWPRAAHPFAPPCYAERTVPDLVACVGAWCGRGQGSRVVVSAHSQGTVIAAAALWQLPEAVRHQVSLLTYGSPLRRLYGRFFPAYMATEDLVRLRSHVPAWRNLYRCTDPIGGPVEVPPAGSEEPVDAPPFTDPLSYGRTPADPLPTQIDGHLRYQTNPAFAAERAALLARLR
ncbi:hypothetical protein [Peterkaempfera sp. SMS 1(5)a]|uniref:hypothetical protein n=1 Tax=Peterkaempfera podocarpi TaxID=3232308 RepID=UPI00366D26B1